MNYRQLHYFLEVYKKQSISKAAETLCLSPQGLSKTIASLETELGVALFIHKSNRIIPTADAAKLSIHAKNLLDEYDIITTKLFQEKDTKKTLSISCSFDVPQLIPTDFYKNFCENYSDILVKITEYPDQDIMKQLDKNEIELAIIPGPFDQQKYLFDPIFTEPFCLVVNKTHPLANHASISICDLKDEPLVIKDIGNSTSIRQYDAFIKAGTVPHIILESSDAHLIHQMAKDNCAIGMSLLYLAKKIQSDAIRVIPFKEKWLTKTLYITSRKDSILSYEAECFKQELTDFLRLQCPE